METPTPLNIPEPLRQAAEQNVNQARQAYEHLVDTLRKAQEQMSRSQGNMTQTAVDIQARMAKFTEQNVQNGFDCAMELSRARSVQEVMEIQSRQAQRQMQTYAVQAQELGQLMALAAQKASVKG